ncbi:MAG: exodeoxyribonuclease VII large subunit [Peptoniphilus sp.]|nr:exodeoxyribonuclease VII large subunit [Peptoniphilus sp.]MDD7362912.1 exodeoxyribonuclease VII large subunit [Bacillota bacterium]MDY6044152.1 exodeoxyribonuclease VII large subunit [Peptoniphilus sp.]
MSHPISISELLDYTKKVLKTDYILRDVHVSGEIAEMTVSQRGHVYFTLKDERARLSCVMFSEDLPDDMEAYRVGLEVELRGFVDVYLPSGRMQLIAKSMSPTGEGALYKLFLKLKDLLQQEGLFDMDKKMPLPENPLKVGMVTSTAGAAQHDFLEVAASRNPAVSVVISPSRVQGEGAGRELAAAFKRLDRRDDIDVIIITRGGGSMEDLFCFNDEHLIRVLSERRHPLVSAVGHEVDTTLCDYVADRRAATPTHGAEMIIPNRTELLDAASSRLGRMGHVVENALIRSAHGERELYYRLKAVFSVESVQRRIADVERIKRDMDERIARVLSDRRRDVEQLRGDLLKVPFHRMYRDHLATLEEVERRMSRSLLSAKERERARLAAQKARFLATAKPRVFHGTDAIEYAKDVAIGDDLSIYFPDGAVDVTVRRVERYDDEL